jgi:DNA-binding NtrC family response regulator
MVAVHKQPEQINVLASAAGWAWPQALRDIFQPRGISLLMADNTNQFVNILNNRRVHTAIIDMDSAATSLAMIKVIKMDYPFLPFIALSTRTECDFLDQALQLEVYGVVAKPVDMEVLRQLLNRLFVKKYDNNIFS